jgi:thioredoxin reductase (NADPH)
MPMRAACRTRVIEVSRMEMWRLMSEMPELSDIVITVLAARRRRHIEARESALVLIGEDFNPEVRKIADFATRNKIPHTSLRLGSPEANAIAESCSLSPGRSAVGFGRDVVDEPSPEKVARLLSICRDYPEDNDFDVLIVGGGPAGVAAGVYAGAEGLNALVVEDIAIGGQAGTSSRIENYMGFPTGISGAALVWRGEVQALKFGTQFAAPRRVANSTGLPTERSVAPSMTDGGSGPGRSWSRRAFSTDDCQSTDSPNSREPGCIMPRPKTKLAIARARRRSSSAEETRPDRPPCF